MTMQQKDTWKKVSALITIGMILIGAIFSSGQFVTDKSNDHSKIIQHDAMIGNQEKRLQSVETDIAVQKSDFQNMKESMSRVERSTDETNRLLKELLLKGKRP